MKNTAINHLQYTGIVTLSQYIGDRKIQIAQVHNEGGNSLFEFFSNCLLGDFQRAEVLRPAKIMLLKSSKSGNSTNVQDVIPASGFISFTTLPEMAYTASGSTITYSFLIARDLLEQTDFNSIGLYAESTQDVERYSAFCEIDFTEMDLNTTSVLVVDWQLTISNGNK